ncbi:MULTISPECIES: hypothetical protein [Paracoccaceae]|jgi:ABC-type dipeptide/oligopeptide/nickel transport system ATPase component|uniref:hypothetical protein n=1 Tax=Paracoccaceae TaxID=31989 RepID=UPI00303CD230
MALTGGIRSFCQRVYVFRAGRIVEAGQAAEVLSNPREAYTKELVAALHRLPDLPAGGCEATIERGAPMARTCPR